ncbi:MAG: hypothetical protein IPF99_24670 [Deltaproteobacteria bacterium]|nr:hypothetical protein [Deltaproteobacteria bacterium]
MRRALCLALLGFGCDDPRRAPTPPRVPPRPVALRPGPMAPSPARLGETPSAAPGDDPLGRCVRRNREAMGPELGRALAALQDDALLEDACGLDLAVRARAPERCASVRLSSLRETCAFRASIAAARPEACPPAPGLRGRDPVCVALASRNAALCAAASLTERTRCLALSAGDPRPCDALDPLLRPACARDLEALRAVLPALPRAAPIAPEERLNAWSTPTGDASVETPVPWLLRGVFLDEAGALWIVDPALGWPSSDAMALERTLVGVTIPSRRGSALALDAALVVAGSQAMSTADGTLRAAVTLTHAPRRRGGRAAGSVVFDGTRGGRSVHAELRFDTFVRDVVMAASLR